MAPSQPLQCVTRLPQAGQGCFAAFLSARPAAAASRWDGLDRPARRASRSWGAHGSRRCEGALRISSRGAPGSGKGVISMIKLQLCRHHLGLLIRAVEAFQPPADENADHDELMAY